jgi:hypothetical protein
MKKQSPVEIPRGREYLAVCDNIIDILLTIWLHEDALSRQLSRQVYS